MKKRGDGASLARRRLEVPHRGTAGHGGGHRGLDGRRRGRTLGVHGRQRGSSTGELPWIDGLEGAASRGLGGGATMGGSMGSVHELDGNG
jgi:hypothetical protein